jgi:hypothetical protein
VLCLWENKEHFEEPTTEETLVEVNHVLEKPELVPGI